MNIWIINHNAIPPSLGSLVRHYYFAKHLLSQGHTVKIFTSGTIHNSDMNLVEKGQLYVEKIIDNVSYVFIRTHKYTKNDIHRIINFLDFPINVLRTCRHLELPDVIYTSSPDIFGSFGSILFAKRKKIPCVFEIRDLWPESLVCVLHWSRKNPVIKAMYLLEKWMYKTADALIFTFEGGKDYVVDKHWQREINLSKIYYINNGVDLAEFNYNLEHYHLEDNDLKDSSYFNVVYTGSIRRANNVGQIVQCAKCLKGKKNIRFLIYGTGTELEELKKYCIHENLTNIKFKGHIDKKYIPYVLSKSDLNLLNYHPSDVLRYGGSQNKLFDYLASGKPVLSNVNQNYSLLERYHCGIASTFETPQQYAEAVLHFYNMSSREYEEMCNNAKETAKLFDYKNLGKNLELILFKVQESYQ